VDCPRAGHGQPSSLPLFFLACHAARGTFPLFGVRPVFSCRPLRPRICFLLCPNLLRFALTASKPPRRISVPWEARLILSLCWSIGYCVLFWRMPRSFNFWGYPPRPGQTRVKGVFSTPLQVRRKVFSGIGFPSRDVATLSIHRFQASVVVSRSGAASFFPTVFRQRPVLKGFFLNRRRFSVWPSSVCFSGREFVRLYLPVHFLLGGATPHSFYHCGALASALRADVRGLTVSAFRFLPAASFIFLPTGSTPLPSNLPSLIPSFTASFRPYTVPDWRAFFRLF